MSGRPWLPVEYPRVPAATQAILDRALDRLGTAGRVTRVSVPSLGDIQITCLGVGRATPPVDGAMRWRISDLHRHGWVGLDSLSCLSLVSAALGLDAPRIERKPTRIEAGIVAATLAAVLHAARASVTLELDDGAWTDGPRVALELELACKAFRERVRAHVPAEWIPSWPLPELAGEAIRRQLKVTLALEAARTVLEMQEWSRAEPGDAIVFDGYPAPPARAPHGGGAGADRLLARCGAHAAEAVCLDGDEIRLCSEFIRDDTRTRLRASRSRASFAYPATTATEGNHEMADDERMARFSMLASAPVEIVAEVGQLVLRADEVLALQPGSVIPLARPRQRLVELKIDDRVWARGELVDVDGELAVRLTELTDEGRGRAGDPPATTAGG